MTRAIANLKKIARLANETAGMLPQRHHSTACHNIKTIAYTILEEQEENSITRPASPVTHFPGHD